MGVEVERVVVRVLGAEYINGDEKTDEDDGDR